MMQIGKKRTVKREELKHKGQKTDGKVVVEPKNDVQTSLMKKK